MLSPHSWNKYSVENGKDIHFDITKEYDLNLQNNWVYYYPIKTESSSSLGIGMKSELIEMTKIMKNKCPYPQIN